jgi:hypothetical protein
MVGEAYSSKFSAWLWAVFHLGPFIRK